MKKRIMMLISIICVLAIGIAGSVYAIQKLNMFQWGQNQKEIVSSQAVEKSVAVVNGQPISEASFENYKAGLANANGTFSDKDVLNKLIRQELIKQEIQRLGYKVTDEDVAAFNDERFALLNEDPAAYKIVKDYVDGLGITMDEYKEQSKEISKTALLANKFKADLQTKYQQDNPESSVHAKAEQEQNFEVYLEQYIDGLYENAKIEITG